MRFDLGYLRCCTCRKSTPGFGDHAIVVQLAKTGEGVRGDIPTVLRRKSTPGFADHANVFQRANTSQRARGDIPTVLCEKSTPAVGHHANVFQRAKTGERVRGNIPAVLYSQCTSVDDQTSPWRASEATIPLSAVVSVAMHRSVQGRHLGGTVHAQSTPVVYLREATVDSADMKYIDDIADEVTEDSREDSGMDDEDSTEAIFRRADARDYHIAHVIESLHDELSRAPTPTLGGRIILPDILSRSPTPFAPYQPEPMLGSRAPTPTFEADSPQAKTPLFMPMSEDEDDISDADRSDATSTAKPGARRAPSPHRSSRPTAKRRRIEPPEDKSLKAFAKTFLDLEAEDDTDEEDDGDNDGVPMADFIDDNPVDDEPIVVVDDSDDEDGFTSQASEVERAEALAAHFDEMARRNRTVVENTDSSPHDIVSRLPHTSDPDLYRFGVPRGSELQLLQYLYRCTGVKSIFFRERGAAGRKRPRFETVAVYVETDDLAALERAMAKYVGAYAMLSRKLVPIDVEDHVSTLNLTQITSLVGRWARVRSGSSLYQGDLVFVEDESNYLFVPRVVYELLSQTPDRPPARLFDSNKCVAAGNKVQKINPSENGVEPDRGRTSDRESLDLPR
ncbi:hypothetical protein DFH06DRAFT_1326674 [Mycena polygramma]|nr:hypothetical protein DFH06DRAFT_1326674 [Mycena polygramma]